MPETGSFFSELDKFAGSIGQVLPADEYKLTITAFNDFKSDDNGNHSMQIEFTVTDDDTFNGRKVWEKVRLDGHYVDKDGKKRHLAFKLFAVVSALAKRHPELCDTLKNIPFFNGDPEKMVVPDSDYAANAWQSYADSLVGLDVLAKTKLINKRVLDEVSNEWKDTDEKKPVIDYYLKKQN